MMKLLEQAKAFLENAPAVTEIELTDGTNRVRIVRAVPPTFPRPLRAHANLPLR